MSHAQGRSAREATGTDGPAGAPAGTAGTAATAGTAGTQPGDATQQDPGARQYVPRPARNFDDTAAEPRPEGAVLGFTITAAVLMMVSGLWNFLEGLAAIIKGQFFVVLPNYVYNVSVTSWGWWHLVIGAAVFVVGVALLFWDKIWARITGVVIACLSAITNFLYIPYSPVWSVIVIALDVFIVWALLAPRTRYTR